jgi:hypothetical protein
MRRLLVPAGVIGAALAAACALSVTAQQPDVPPGTQRRSLPEADRMGPAPVSRLEMFLVRPGRVVVRDTWRVGRIETRGADAGAQETRGMLRVNAVIAYAHERPEDTVTGLELVLQDEVQDSVYLFDTPQIADLMNAIQTVTDAAARLREPQQDVGRRVIYNFEGLEIGMRPRRSGGYLAPIGPEGPTVNLTFDDFTQFRRLLEDVQTTLKREVSRRPAQQQQQPPPEDPEQ